MAGVLLTFIVLSELWSWLTPAWEANDEPDHVENIQIVASGRLPVVGDNVEGGQPPLYYVVAAAWQDLLGIDPIANEPRRSAPSPPSPQRLEFAHDYSDPERDAALSVHLLRQVSILCGAVTVFLTYLIAREFGARWQMSVVVALTVAVWPRFTVISSVVPEPQSGRCLLCGSVVDGASME